MRSEPVAALVRAGPAVPPWQPPQVAADALGQPLTEDPGQEQPLDDAPNGSGLNQPGAISAWACCA